MRPFFRRFLLRAVASSAVPTRYRARLYNAFGGHFGQGAVVHAGAILDGLNIKTGRGLFVNRGLYFDGLADLRVGDRVAIGPFVRILTAGHVTVDPLKRCSPQSVPAPVTIGDGVWLAGGVTVLPGVTIAAGCVIAAGSVVTGDTVADGLYAGVPARRVRELPVGSSDRST